SSLCPLSLLSKKGPRRTSLSQTRALPADLSLFRSLSTLLSSQEKRSPQSNLRLGQNLGAGCVRRNAARPLRWLSRKLFRLGGTYGCHVREVRPGLLAGSHEDAPRLRKRLAVADHLHGQVVVVGLAFHQRRRGERPLAISDFDDLVVDA